MAETLFVNLKKTPTARLKRAGERIEKEITDRRIRELKGQKCLCDRYTCPRCIELSELGE